MSRFNTTAERVIPASPVASETAPSGRTHEGAPGYTRDAKSELFLLAVVNMGGDNTFYESGNDRDSRFATLVHQLAVADREWMAGFIPWLRNDANMRTASLVAAAETARALLAAGLPGGRQVIASALARGDEPGELLAYWRARYGRAIPKPVKRGIGDAALRLWREYPLLKYDAGSHGIRFADVLALTHPGDRKGSAQGHKFQGAWQHDLFGYAVDRRYGRDEAESLAMVRASQRLRALAAGDPSVLLDTERLREAGMTWEDVLSLAGTKVGKRDLWTALVPVMGYMALLRNLRNLDEAGVGDDVARAVGERLADPAQVARSRQFPMRFLSAYLAAPSLRWAWPLEQALGYSLANIPALGGNTLVLVDRSGSMFDRVSAKSSLSRADSAAIFGASLALRANAADLVEFGTGSQPVTFGLGESVLKVMSRFTSMGGTNTAEAVRRHFSGHDRVVILTDEQAWGGYYGEEPTRRVPASVPVYTWNLAGYRHGHGPSGTGNRHTFGGLSDVSFKMISCLEAARDAAWPWLLPSAQRAA